MTPFSVLLISGLAFASGYLLRAEKIWTLQQENARLLSDLDSAVRDIGAMLGKRNHPTNGATRNPGSNVVVLRDQM